MSVEKEINDLGKERTLLKAKLYSMNIERQELTARGMEIDGRLTDLRTLREGGKAGD